MAKPNILLLTTDEQRFDTIAAMGYPYMVTPNLDRLVQEGCSFPLAHTPNPACVPARHNIISGLYSRVTGMDDNYFGGAVVMPRDVPTMAGLLSDAGYETVAVGKMHFQTVRQHNGFGRMELMEEMPHHLADDEYARYLHSHGGQHIQSLHGVRNLLYMLPQTPLQPEEHTGTVWVADRLIHHLKHNAGKRPFFYWGSWIAPHPPFSTPKRFADLYRGRELPRPLPPHKNPPPLTVENQKIADWYDQDVARMAREHYYGAISFVDEQIGRVLEALQQEGLLENTLIVFTSDHGEMLGDFGSYHKFQPYEGSVRIPLVMRWPAAFASGSRYEGFCDLNDLLPTMLQAAGVSYPGPYALPGGSLLKDCAESEKDRTIQFAEHSHGSRRWVSARTKQYKYVYYYAGGLEELFDLTADPTEQHNLLAGGGLVGAYQAAYTALKQQLLQWEREWGLSGGADENGFLPCPPLELAPRLPTSFPVFPRNMRDTTGLMSHAQEVVAAVTQLPAVDLTRLRWSEWEASGRIEPGLRDKVLALRQESGATQGSEG